MSNTAAAWLLLFIVGTILAFAKDPIYALYTYLWVLYNDPQSKWWSAGIPSLRWSLIAATIMLLAIILRSPRSGLPRWHANWAARCLILYVAWMWTQTIWAVDPVEHFEGCVLFTKYIVLFFAIYRLASSEEAFTSFSFGHVLGCFILGWNAYNTTVVGRMETVILPNADDSNLIAAHLVTGLVFGGFLWLWVKTSARWLAFFSLPFILNAIILTVSRSGTISIVCAGLTALIWAPRRMRLKIGGILVLGGAMLILLSRDDYFWDRISTIWSDAPNREATSEGRIALMEFGLKMVADYPLGAGHRGYTWLSSKYMPEVYLSGGHRSAHATWVAVMVDQGWPGLFLFLALHLWVGFRLLRLLSLDRRGLPRSLALKRAAVASSLTVCLSSGLLVNLMKAEVEIWLLALLAVIDGICHDAVSQVEEHDQDSTRLTGLGLPAQTRRVLNVEPFGE